MKTKLLLVAMLLPAILWAQVSPVSSVRLKGTVADSITKKTIPFVTVSLFKMPGAIVYKRMASGTDGAFEFLIKDTGTYLLSVHLIGYAEYKQSLLIAKTEPVIDLGKIVLAEAAHTLKEVSIIADKPLIKVEADKISYSTESDPESQTSNVLDMMRKVPLLTVDGEDNIQLKGASNFKIFINGKPSTMLSNNPKDVLKNMPANTIKDIEVITSPGAKYDAEGIGGIINIITIKKKVKGYNGSVNIGADTRGSLNSSLYLAASLGKFAFSTNMSAYWYQSPQATLNTYRENLKSENFRYTNFNGVSNNKGISPWGNGEASYEIDSLNLISLSFNLWYGKPQSTSERKVTVFDSNNQMVQAYNILGLSHNEYGSPEGSIDYQKLFKRNKNQILTFSYKFNKNPNNSMGETEYEPELNYFKMMRKSSTNASTIEQTGQIDYVHPFSKNHQLESGAKYIHRANQSFSEYFLWDYNTNIYVSEMESNDFNYTQQIGALYTSYNFKHNKIGFKAGVRVEQSETKGSISAQDTSFTNKSLEFVPNVNFSYQLSPFQNIRFSYTMRIQRPSIWFLNPYINKFDNYTISYGNPALNPERYHNIDLNYGRFGKKSNLNISAFYSFTNNSIESFSWMVDTVSYSSYYNIGKIWSAGLSVYGMLRFTPKFSININGSARYSDIESSLDNQLSNSGWGGSFHSSIQYSFLKTFRLSAFAGIFYRGVTLQGKSSPYHFNGLSLNKSFLKDKLTVSLSLRNPLWKDMKFINETTDPNFYIKSEYVNPARSVGINIRYRFGQMQTEVKKSKRSIRNDDIKAGESGGGEAESGTK
jgi:outer membrane receptor protein involved in Fe transport